MLVKTIAKYYFMLIKLIIEGKFALISNVFDMRNGGIKACASLYINFK